MPPHKPNRYEVELRKNLDEAQKTIAARDTDIEGLRTRLAAKIEEIAALERKAGEADKLRENNRQLGAEVVKGSLEISGMAQKLSSHEIAAVISRKTIRDLEIQNAALRAALKAVL